MKVRTITTETEDTIMRYTGDEFTLGDDGTLDTIINFRGQEFRFTDTAEFRDSNGYLDMRRFLHYHAEGIVNTYQEGEA